MADSNPISPENERGKIGTIPEVPEEVSDSSPTNSSSPKEKPVERTQSLGPDGKPLPGPGEVQKIRAERHGKNDFR